MIAIALAAQAQCAFLRPSKVNLSIDWRWRECAASPDLLEIVVTGFSVSDCGNGKSEASL
jgi:hypothetical protein